MNALFAMQCRSSRHCQSVGPAAMPQQRRTSATPDCPNDGMLGLGMFPVPNAKDCGGQRRGLAAPPLLPSLLACGPDTTLPDAEHQFAMLASQCGLAFEAAISAHDAASMGWPEKK